MPPPTTNKTFIGRVSQGRDWTITVIHDGPAPLVESTTPDGHSWGYGGSGPAQAALDILWEVYDAEPSASLFQEFKWKVIASLEQDKEWKMTEAEIRSWVDANGGWRPREGF